MGTSVSSSSPPAKLGTGGEAQLAGYTAELKTPWRTRPTSIAVMPTDQMSAFSLYPSSLLAMTSAEMHKGLEG